MTNESWHDSRWLETQPPWLETWTLWLAIRLETLPKWLANSPGWKYIYLYIAYVVNWILCCSIWQDVLEFVDCGCNGFLSNICLVIASYNDMFLNRQQDELRPHMFSVFCYAVLVLIVFSSLIADPIQWIK